MDEKARKESSCGAKVLYNGFEFDETAMELVEARSETVPRKAALLTLKTREVCEDCNQGWMSDLEEAVKSTILQLVSSAKTGDRYRAGP
jgi:hypothetical protein